MGDRQEVKYMSRQARLQSNLRAESKRSKMSAWVDRIHAQIESYPGILSTVSSISGKFAQFESIILKNDEKVKIVIKLQSGASKGSILINPYMFPKNFFVVDQDDDAFVHVILKDAIESIE